jgi:3',5'-cyclic-AMP phosphodiesterase
MSVPFVLAQLSDPHVGADWGQGDPVAGLAAAVASMPRAPDAVLVSGDLAEHAADAEYEQVRELLAPLEAPLHVLPGNHDDRDALRRHFDVPGDGGEPVRYAVDLGPLRLVVIDTTVPGEDYGALDAETLAWLDDALADAPDPPTLVAMHHTPLLTGVPATDEFGVPAADRAGLAAVVGRHPHVRRIAGGHVHRTIAAELGGRPVLSVPSTYLQGRLDFTAQEAEMVAEPAGFALHTVVDGELVSHIQPVG